MFNKKKNKETDPVKEKCQEGEKKDKEKTAED